MISVPAAALIGQVVGVPEQFGGDADAGLQAFGGAEFLHQPVLQGDLLDLVNDRARSS